MKIAKILKPGVTTRELDKVAEEFIRDNGAIPTFKVSESIWKSFPGIHLYFC